MLLYLTSYRPQTIAHKLSVLYLLMLVELILSSILFHGNVTTPTNSIALFIMNQTWLLIIIKALLPGGLLTYLFYYLTQTDSAKIIRLSNTGIAILLIIYGFTNLVHLSHWFLSPILQATS